MLNLLKFENFLPAARRSGRRVDRHATAASVTLSCPGMDMFDGVLVDLSIHGARIRTAARVRIDSPILLEIHTMPLLSGRVVWTEGRELGMSFDRSLHASVLDHLLARSGALSA